MNTATLALGIDVGTQGARVLVSTAEGQIMAQAAREFAGLTLKGLPEGHLEQEPAAWWRASCECLREAVAQLRAAGHAPEAIAAAAVDSTSATVVLLDKHKKPVRPAVMYNDRRAAAEAEEINRSNEAYLAKVGYRFNSSFALPKLLWLLRHEPENWARTRHVVHAADYIAGCLSGVFEATDASNALKTGFDVVDFQWPDFIQQDLGIASGLLPRVVRSGDAIANVSSTAAGNTGLSTRTLVVAGMTDGCADQVASGAHRIGDWNSVLGTTLIIKGLTRQLLRDPAARVYCHSHPMGHWMPGGASNVGARVLDERFPAADKDALGRAALAVSPTRWAVYPLTQIGERFPFVHGGATGFIAGLDAERCTEDATTPEMYAAHLEGVAFVERLSYDVLRDLGAEVGPRLYTTGGGSRSLEWMQIRADVLGRELVRAAQPGAAMGSAIVAASRTLFDDIAQAASGMVQKERVVQPRANMLSDYSDGYERFLRGLLERGYLES